MHTRTKHCLLSIILFLLVHFSAVAQQLLFKHYKIQDGLSSMMQYGILQDRHGFIWTCNDAGISRFDGKDFLHITVKDGLPDNEILSITEDGKGRIWYTSLKGKVGYIENLHVNPLTGLNKRLRNVKVCSMAKDCSGNLYLGTHGGIIKISLDLLSYKYLARISCNFRPLFIDCKNNQILNLSNKDDVIVIKNNNETVYHIPHLSITSTIIKGSNITKDYPVIYDGEAVMILDSLLHPQKIINDNIIKHQRLITLCIDKENTLWLGTYTGLYCYKYINNRYVYSGHYLVNKKISCIFQDNENNIWATSLGEGLFQMISNKLFTITNEDGLSDNSVLSVLKVKDKLLASTEKGCLNIIDSTTLAIKHAYSVATSYEFSQASLVRLCKANNEIVIASDAGLQRLDNGKIIPIRPHDHFITNSIKDLYFSGNLLLIATNGGIISCSDNKFTDITKSRTSCVFQSADGTIWFSDDIGLVYIRNGVLKRKTDPAGLLSERMSQIREDHAGGLWLASQGKGIIYLKGDSIVNITTKNGLASDICNSFLIEKDRIWVATNEGISKITFTGTNKSKFTIQNISSTQGLPSDKVFSIIKSGNTIFVGSNGGISYFGQDDIKPNNIPPLVYISGVKIVEKDTALTSRYNLSYNENNIKIEFTGLSFKSLGNVKYKYKIEGLDTNWIATPYNVASYPSLPTGNYRFLVKAINDNGVESKQTASISIIICPPFWLTAWCKCLTLSIVILLSFLFYYNRLKRLKAKNALQKQIMEAEQYALRAQMNPHFVFNALNSIQRFMLQKDPLMANEYLSKFGNLIRRIFENSMHPYIPVNDEIETLKLYIQIESLRFDNAFEYNLIIDEDLDKYNIEIPPMIIQPYVENAIWHGLLHKPKKGILTVEIKKLPGKIVCIVEDNGIGRKESASLKSQSAPLRYSAGMNITEKRLQNLTELTHKLYSVTAIDLLDDDNKPLGTRIVIEFSDLQ